MSGPSFPVPVQSLWYKPFETYGIVGCLKKVISIFCCIGGKKKKKPQSLVCILVMCLVPLRTETSVESRLTIVWSTRPSWSWSTLTSPRMHILCVALAPSLSSCKSTPVRHFSCCLRCSQMQSLIYLASLRKHRACVRRKQKCRSTEEYMSCSILAIALFLCAKKKKRKTKRKRKKKVQSAQNLKREFVKKDVIWHNMTYYSSCNWLLLCFYQWTACFGA